MFTKEWSFLQTPIQFKDNLINTKANLRKKRVIAQLQSQSFAIISRISLEYRTAFHDLANNTQQLTFKSAPLLLLIHVRHYKYQKSFHLLTKLGVRSSRVQFMTTPFVTFSTEFTQFVEWANNYHKYVSNRSVPKQKTSFTFRCTLLFVNLCRYFPRSYCLSLVFVLFHRSFNSR